MSQATTPSAGHRALLAAPLLALLGACGLKGPLTLPERGEGNVVIRGPGAPTPAGSTPAPAPAPTPAPTPEPATPAPPDPPR